MRLGVVLCAAVIAAPAWAQSGQAPRNGTIIGTVARDSMGTMVGEAQVQLPQLNRSATTNWLGEFQFPEVPAGRYAVTVRAIGFQPLLDSLDVKPGSRVDADIILSAEPVSLATQHTTANAVEKRLPPGLQEMQDRMNEHMGGYFVTDSVLRANNEKKLTDLVAKLPTISQQLGASGTGIYLANGREQGDGGPVFQRRVDKPDQTFPHGMCYISVYVDGAKYFVGPATETNPPPDFAALWAHDYSGIEYYPGGSTIPAEYNATGTHCGVLLLWTRHTP